MFPRISGVRPLADYRLELSFKDGAKGEVDLSDWIVGRGGVFTALEDPEFFDEVRVNNEWGTIEWPNGVDFCPDVLYSRATGKPIPSEKPAMIAPLQQTD